MASRQLVSCWDIIDKLCACLGSLCFCSHGQPFCALLVPQCVTVSSLLLPQPLHGNKLLEAGRKSDPAL